MVKDIWTRLENECNRLKELRVKLSEGALEEREGGYGNMEEAATEYSEIGRQLASLQRNKDQLAEVEHALEKLEKGTYGLCDSCGKPIPLARLEAIPQANLCLDCKTSQATKAKSHG